MMEYTRRITGVISNHSLCPCIGGEMIDEIISEMIGSNCCFAGTVSIVITDLTEDTGAVQKKTPTSGHWEAAQAAASVDISLFSETRGTAMEEEAAASMDDEGGPHD